MILRVRHRSIKDKSDEKLLSDFLESGELDILGDLYSRYMHLVYGVCLKYLKNRDESMDSVMQIFEKLIIEVPKHNIESFKSWLHAVTKNYCLMQLRSQKSLNEKQKEWIEDSMIFMEKGQELHLIDNEGPDLDKRLYDCIEKLKSEQRACIKQFYFENKCYTEISVDLNLDEKKVKSHLQNGKRNLKLCIEEKNGAKQ